MASSTRSLALVVALAIVGSARVARAQDAAIGFAQEHFLHARDLYNAGRYTPALDEFRAAERLYDSPNSLLYIARCLRELGTAVDAVAAYDLAVAAADAGGPRYADTDTAAHAERAALEAQVARLRVVLTTAPRGVRVAYDGRTLDAAARSAALPVAPRTGSLVVDAPGYASYRQRVTPAAGRETRVEVTLTREPAPPPVAHVRDERHGPSRAPAWTLLVAGGVVSLGAGALWLATDVHFNALSQACQPVGSSDCPENPAGAALGRGLQTAADVSTVVGAAGLALGIVLLALPGPTRRGVRLGVLPDRVVVAGSF